MAMTPVRSLVLLAALASPAVADDDDSDGLPPAPAHAVTLGVMGYGGRLAGVPQGGWGPDLELALGHDRWQYFVEAAAMRSTLGPDRDQLVGHAVRGGVGARWLARSFELGRTGTLDMHVEAFAGAARLSFDGMKRVSRPDLGVGVGYIIRRTERHQLGLRLSARIFFAPTDHEVATAVCRGTCTTTADPSSSGLMVVFGAQL